jgi:hypothetical protein
MKDKRPEIMKGSNNNFTTLSKIIGPSLCVAPPLDDASEPQDRVVRKPELDVSSLPAAEQAHIAELMQEPEEKGKGALPPTFIEVPEGNPYVRVFQGVEIDIYRVLKLWGITEPGVQHALKKLLRRGRADKTPKQDLQDAIISLQRTVEMMEEDSSD